MTDLSIIIVNRNNQELLEPCLNSIKSSTHRASYEVIFVDNGSTDESLSLIRAKFPRVRIIENKANLGFSRANNQGWQIAQGRYALLLNTDTIVKDSAFDRMLEFMDEHPRAGACGPKLTDVDGRPQHQGGLFARKFWLAKEPVTVDYVLGACLMVRREVIDRVGGLDENFFFSNDDLDWGLRIRKAGWQVYFLPQAEVVHFGGFTIKHFNQRLFVEGFRGGLYFCRKHYGGIAYQLYRTLLAVAMFLIIPLTSILYPLLPNKEKLGAYWRIFLICLSGQLLPTPYSLSSNILLISNGHAEDLAAAAIGARLKEFSLQALPLVGFGQAYDKQGIANLGLKKMLPSGGFAKEGWFHFLRDIWSGLFGLTFRQIMVLRHAGKCADLIVAVGDAYLVALCGLFAKKPLIFIDGPKSVKIAGYWPLELWLMKKFCRQIIVQDQVTADHLTAKGLPAVYLGSWVMDYVPTTGENFDLPKDELVIGILPGTREEAYQNLGLILDVLAEMEEVKFTGLIASTLDKTKLTEHGLLDRIKNFPRPLRLIEGKFGDVCLRSKLIIGLAGIANEQAVAFGKPVVCFPGSGAQTTLRRWQEIQKITGNSMLILTGDTKAKAEKIIALLHDQSKLAEMGRLGKASKPQWGGVARITKLISERLLTL